MAAPSAGLVEIKPPFSRAEVLRFLDPPPPASDLPEIKAAQAMLVFSESYPATAAAPQVFTPAFNFSPLHPYHFETPLVA